MHQVARDLAIKYFSENSSFELDDIPDKVVRYHIVDAITIAWGAGGIVSILSQMPDDLMNRFHQIAEDYEGLTFLEKAFGQFEELSGIDFKSEDLGSRHQKVLDFENDHFDEISQIDEMIDQRYDTLDELRDQLAQEISEGL